MRREIETHCKVEFKGYKRVFIHTCGNPKCPYKK